MHQTIPYILELLFSKHSSIKLKSKTKLSDAITIITKLNPKLNNDPLVGFKKERFIPKKLAIKAKI